MMPASSKKLPLVVAITGATGVIYGIEMLRVLRELGQETHLILSEAAGLNLSLETKHSVDDVKSLAHVVYSNKDVGAAACQRFLPYARHDRRAVHHQDAVGDRQFLHL